MSVRILDLMQGARNCVRGCANVQKGENVLILTGNSGFADPLVVEAIALASQEAGADVTVASAREFDPRVEEPPKIIQAAFFNADTVFSITPGEATLHCRTGRMALMEYGAKLIPVVANTAELLASEWAKFPTEIYWAIIRKVYNQVTSGKTIHVKSPKGTDCFAEISHHELMGFSSDEKGIPCPPKPGDGMFTMFPLGVLGMIPQPPAYGILVFDALLGIKGHLREPIRVTMEKQYITNIDGGSEARWFQNLISSKKQKGIEADFWIEIMWGLNPKASIERGLELLHLRESETTRRAGTLHFGVGKSGSGFHWDGVLVEPFSVYIDNEPMIENGRLTALDDPEVRAVAKEFGNPDVLLTEVP